MKFIQTYQEAEQPRRTDGPTPSFWRLYSQSAFDLSCFCFFFLRHWDLREQSRLFLCREEKNTPFRLRKLHFYCQRRLSRAFENISDWSVKKSWCKYPPQVCASPVCNTCVFLSSTRRITTDGQRSQLLSLVCNSFFLSFFLCTVLSF